MRRGGFQKCRKRLVGEGGMYVFFLKGGGRNEGETLCRLGEFYVQFVGFVRACYGMHMFLVESSILKV